MTSTSSSPRTDFALIQVDSPAVSPVTLAWQHLTVSEPSQHTKHPDIALKRPLLQGVSGTAHPGELLAITGPVDAGTSVLLECLAQRRTTTTGELSFQPHQPDAVSVGFVAKENLVFGALTVLEHLTFQAELRLGACTTHEDRINRALEVAAHLGLTNELDTHIGVAGEANALAADKCKVLAIAVELLSLPSVVLLDEPASGMDAFQAETVFRALQLLARKGHTVMATIAPDAPSSLFFLIDKLVLLADGRVVYSGVTTDSLTFLEANGVRCPSFMNPFEFFNKRLALNALSGASQVEQLIAAWNARQLEPLVDDIAMLTRRSTITPCRRVRPTRWTQYSVLMCRNLLKLLHDTASIKARLGAMVFLTLLIGLVFIRLDLTQRDIQPFSSACFFMATTQFLYTAMPELLSAPKEVATALHEHHNGLYHVLRWYVIKNLSELPLQLIYPLVFIAPTYFMVGFTVNLETFFTFYLFLALLVSAATGIAYCFACIAPQTGRAIKLSLIYLSPSLVFGGAFVTRKTTPVYFVWLQQLSPIKYCYHGLMRAFWKPVHTISCPPGTVCRATSGMAVLISNVVEPNKFLSDVVILLLINLAFRVLGGVALAWRTRMSRTQ